MPCAGTQSRARGAGVGGGELGERRGEGWGACARGGGGGGPQVALGAPIGADGLVIGWLDGKMQLAEGEEPLKRALCAAHLRMYPHE